MSQQDIYDNVTKKQTATDVKSYLKEKYKLSAQKQIDIEPPKTSRKSSTYHNTNKQSKKA